MGGCRALIQSNHLDLNADPPNIRVCKYNNSFIHSFILSFFRSLFLSLISSVVHSPVCPSIRPYFTIPSFLYLFHHSINPGILKLITHSISILSINSAFHSIRSPLLSSSLPPPLLQPSLAPLKHSSFPSFTPFYPDFLPPLFRSFRLSFSHSVPTRSIHSKYVSSSFHIFNP